MLLPLPPKLVPHVSALDGLAPKVRAGALEVVARMKDDGYNPVIFETLRTLERQAYLYGFGRSYDERPKPRGIVTKVADARDGWHFYGLAVDIVENDKDPWVAPLGFWNALGKHAEALGFAWGGRWTNPYDAPHIQWGRCRLKPSKRAKELHAQGGNRAVWEVVEAI